MTETDVRVLVSMLGEFGDAAEAVIHRWGELTGVTKPFGGFYGLEDLWLTENHLNFTITPEDGSGSIRRSLPISYLYAKDWESEVLADLEEQRLQEAEAKKQQDLGDQAYWETI
jgi:hypothetical protein